MTPRERLQYLADVVLPNVKRSEFDIGWWDCGTVACAVGHACRDPVLMAEGLSLRRISIETLPAPHFRGFNNIWAARAFFGIKDNEWAGHLFLPRGYAFIPDANDVRRRILNYIKEHPEQ